MGKTIVIDPGHGGYDAGACGNGLQEKDITLNVALGLRSLLEAAGLTVILTRDSDVSPSGDSDLNHDLESRCEIANSNNADFFLSIHVNAGGGNGCEAEVFGDGGVTHNVALQMVQSVGSVMGIHGEPLKDGSGLYVIRYTKAPAVLLEIGFIDSTDADKIKANLSQFAGLIAPAIVAFLGGTIPEDHQASDYEGSPFKADIDAVKAAGIMVGDDDLHFRPTEAVTREQLAVVIHRLLTREAAEEKQEETPVNPPSA